VQPNDTPDSLFARVQAAEKQYLAADVMAFVTAQKEYQKSHE
jgi:folate-dependent phosphoribosylglycinamide formyltransferase PurN